MQLCNVTAAELDDRPKINPHRIGLCVLRGLKMEQSPNEVSNSVAQVSVVTVVLPTILMSLVLVVAALGWIIRKR